MKRILGLDLGTNSIGWAVVNEAENVNEKSSIEKIGVRVVPLSVDEQTNFEKGKSITTNADRTLKRSMRRNLQRYKMRRDNLIEILKDNGLISDSTLLAENGNATTFQTYRLRAKAASEEISLEELSRVLLMINKKRGYKSSRKINSSEDGQLIDGMSVALDLYNRSLTPGQYVLELIKNGKYYTPDFYKSDLYEEFIRIWESQSVFYPDLLSEELKELLKNKNKSQTWAICQKPFNLVGIKRTVKGNDLKKENYEWRVKALDSQIGLEELAIVFQEINSQINGSSGYLGAISDRSKELYFNKLTVGQFLMSELENDPHYSLKNQVFYRQDYLDEFEKIWETQSAFHKELTPELKQEIRDVVIFFQRRLKSQKGLISFCEFENREISVAQDGKVRQKTIGLRVCPKSSPLFQEFKIWQILNNITISGKVIPKDQVDLFGSSVQFEEGTRSLTQEEKEILFAELSVKPQLTNNEVLKMLFSNPKELEINYKVVEGNKTLAALFEVFASIVELSGHGEMDLKKMSSSKIIKTITEIFDAIGIDTRILHFNSDLEDPDFQTQPLYKLWHLLYSYEGDNSVAGNEKLINKLTQLFGFENVYSTLVANVKLQPDYGSLSSKAIRKILPYLKEGNDYSIACEYAGYRHSKSSLTKEELDKKILKDKLLIIPKNTLRNPVVEKILNQMINVVNATIDTYGKPDEIRIELARELKKNAKEREDLTAAISKTTKEFETYRTVLQKEFGLTNVSRNDILRYRLYLELEPHGFKTLYSNTYIPREKIFSKEFDIEHIIPQARLFDDSFSNKTLEVRAINLEKSNSTAFDFIVSKYGEENANNYLTTIESLYKSGNISKAKFNKLKMREADIPSGFIERDLRDSQYIAKYAKGLLSSLVRTVVSTTGSITDRLREDWQLVDVMQELNWDKYDKLGMTEIVEGRDGQRIRRINDWTKRNDHRHHAMDALTIAFTKPSHIQYLNNLNARSDKAGSIYGIEQKELYRDKRNKLRFKSPMPLDEFRSEAKRQLEDVLISIKAKNKVVTRNLNVTKKGKGNNSKTQLTPRGQLHLETIFGGSQFYSTKMVTVNGSFDKDQIMSVANQKHRDALLKRLELFDNDPKKAFTGKNNLDVNPVYLDKEHTQMVPKKVKTVCLETQYTIRKPVAPGLSVNKIVDKRVRDVVQARLDLYDGDDKKAFSNLDENPIWLNEEKGISIKTVTITGISNAVSLHEKRDHNGNLILDSDGKPQPVDFVNTGNNHHVAVYRDSDGNIQEVVVSFYEATTRANLGLPIVDKDYNVSEGWQFLFTMKQNEYFVFPNKETGFDPNEIDLMNPDNYSIISPNLYRVQQFSFKNFVFRHHLETTVDMNYKMKGITWTDIRCSGGLAGLVKVRVNHIGQIVSVGEY